MLYLRWNDVGVVLGRSTSLYIGGDKGCMVTGICEEGGGCV